MRCVVTASWATLAAAVSVGQIPVIPLPNAGNASIPRILLGTGGGGGGYNASAWLAAGGGGFDTAQTYCYSSVRPFCSPVAIANAISGSDGVTPFIISKTEPEDFGGDGIVYGFGRPATNAIMQMSACFARVPQSRRPATPIRVAVSLKTLGMLMFHQAGRHATDNNIHPPCFNASAAGPAGPGTYAACRIQSFEVRVAVLPARTHVLSCRRYALTFLQAALSGAKAAGVSAVGVSNWQQRELQQVRRGGGGFACGHCDSPPRPHYWQVFDATGSWPAALEVRSSQGCGAASALLATLWPRACCLCASAGRVPPLLARGRARGLLRRARHRRHQLRAPRSAAAGARQGAGRCMGGRWVPCEAQVRDLRAMVVGSDDR